MERAGNEAEALLAVVNEICAEVGSPGAPPAAGAASATAAGGREGVWEKLGPEEEALVLTMRSRLAAIAAATGPGAEEEIAERAIRVALDGAEAVMRGELMSGDLAQLQELMPSLVYLVSVPRLGLDEALELSRRTAELLDETSRPQ